MKINSNSFLPTRRNALVALMAMVALFAGSLRATTVYYDGTNYATLDTQFDSPQVNVIFQSNYITWGGGYNDLTNALYTNVGQPFVIDFVSLDGSQVTLQSFDLGNWLDAGAATQYQVYDLSNLVTPLFSSGSFNVIYDTQSHPTFNVGLSSTIGLRLSIGPDMYNIGVNNIVFNSSPSNVPDSGSVVALMAVALSGLGVLRRRFSRN